MNRLQTRLRDRLVNFSLKRFYVSLKTDLSEEGKVPNTFCRDD